MKNKIEKNLTNIGEFDHIVNSGLENNVEYIMFLEKWVNVLGIKVDNLNDLLLLRENKHHNDLIEASNTLNVLKEENQRLHTELSQKVDYIHEIIEIKEQLKQSQNQKAIDELENTRDIIEDILDKALKNSSLNEKYYDDLLDFIDQKINKLKREKVK